jgi:predicted TIM-barrel fold metal-dependent hydrolase
MAKEYPNIFYELTATHDDRGVVERLCEGVGSNRLLFGTDLPWFSTFTGIGAILAADISDEDRRNIFYRNAQPILKPFVPEIELKP